MDWNNFFRDELKNIQPYQPGLREEQIREIAEVADIHKLSSNESPFPPFPSALVAMQECLTGLNEYSDGSCYELKQELMKQYNQSFDHIMVGNGNNELLMLLAEACLVPGSRIAYCWPSFVVYRIGAEIAGAEYDEVPLKKDGSYDLEGLLEVITPQTKMLVVCSPNNPTGGIVTQAEFERFMAAVPEHVLLVMDMAYNEFATDPRQVDPMRFFDGKRPLAVFYTFSKIYGLAGARVGYGFAPKPLVEAIDKLREPFNVNTVAQVGARASLGHHEELERRQKENVKQRAVLCEAFDRLKLKYYKSEANFVWVFVPEPLETFEKLLKRGVIVRSFAGGGGLRVGVGNSENTRATVEAFELLFGS